MYQDMISLFPHQQEALQETKDFDNIAVYHDMGLGKLANIGDDISDEFLQGKVIAQFKKIVSGNDIKAENKGQDAYFFKPTVKLLFSANEIPRMRNKGFEAIKRRLVIIPFNAKFKNKRMEGVKHGKVWKNRCDI